MSEPELNTLMTPELLAVINILVDGQALDDAWLIRPSLLFTRPQVTEWTVPVNAWHLDIPRLPIAGLSGMQMFTFLDTVVPRGGGTLVVTGSHRLLNTTGKYLRTPGCGGIAQERSLFSGFNVRGLPKS